MTFPRTSLRSFLASAKHALTSFTPQSAPITFIIGNESADLDSLCSAVLLAYLRTTTSRSSTLYIPVSNLPTSDLALRPELNPVLLHADLKPSDLITTSNLPPSLPADQSRWILVDHNALQGQLGKLYGDRVEGCIDHHEEENQVPRETGSEEPRIVRKSGSCASLVVEYCRSAWDSLPRETQEQRRWNAELARLAIAPILIDTANLTSETKTTEVDREGVRYLEALIGEGFDRAVYFEEVQRAKEDIGSLSLRDILRKDYKQWDASQRAGGTVVLGISSVVKDMAWLIKKAGGRDEFLEAVKAFAEERGLGVCSIMTTSHQEGSFRRELFVWGRGKEGVEAAKNFHAESGESLGLEVWQEATLDDQSDGWRRCWWQKRIENSRKQVAPLLRTAMS